MNPIRYSEGRLGRPCEGFLVMQATSPLSSSPSPEPLLNGKKVLNYKNGEGQQTVSPLQY